MSTRGLLCLLGLTLLAALPAQAGRRTSGDYRLDVANQAMLAKHGIYEFTVRVRDRDGQPVQDADVRLRLHSFEPDGERLVALRSIGHGYYRTVAHLHPGLDSESPRYARVVIQAGQGR